MEERNKVTSIFKSNDPEKLVVFHAASLQNEIRFYLNDTKYLTAVECEEGCSIKLGEEREEVQQKSKFSIIRENLKEFIKLSSIFMGISILGFIGVLYLSKIIDNILILGSIINVGVVKTTSTFF